ncbi:MAG: right-handed parallel beta-helix repeat-containing protein [Paludibacter sp.]|nr:right-handed parallel beta-helix repeat-containing protein [Paludibacter sp.]
MLKFNKKLLFSGMCLFALFLILQSCDDEIFTTNPSDSITFSKDTLTFDTVFSTIGSTTGKFLVYNPNNKAIHISSVKLAGGASSQFRLNVDGAVNTDNSFSDIDISAHDSMYVFVEVTVNPTDVNSPVLVADSVLFTVNGNLRTVRLEAFGQDVVLFKNKYLINNTTLLANKPYLIYGYLAVDTAKTLTIPAGCKLYFHNNANLIVYGNLRVEGTFEKPVEMRGDRFDNMDFSTPVPYNYVAGQWGGIYLLGSGGNHLLQNVIINSGYVGVYFSNDNRNELPYLHIINSKIQNFVYYGIVVQNGNLLVENSEISNTGSCTVYLSGGKHVFIQSTIANFYNSNLYEPSSRDKNPAMVIMGLYRMAPMETEIKNCIVAGTLKNELSIVSRFLPGYKGTFSSSFIRRDSIYTYSQFENITWHQTDNAELFVHPKYDAEGNYYFNFMPDSLSSARGIADPDIASQYPLDLNGNSRLEDGTPDAGAYEWQGK